MVRTAGAQTPVNNSGIRPTRLVVSPFQSAEEPTLTPDRLRADLEAELGRPVLLGHDVTPDADVLTIIYRVASKELTVGYVPETGATVVRTLSVAGTVDEITALAVLLAGNVARDQAGELLGPPRRPDAIARAAPAPAERPVAPAPASTAPDVVPLPGPTSSASLVLEEPEPTSLLHEVRIRAVVWAGNLSLMNIGVSVSDRYAYALLSASGHVERGRSMAGPGLAVGARIPMRSVWLQSDFGTTYLYGLDAIFPPPPAPLDSAGYYTNDRLVTRVRSALVFSPFQHLELFAGFAYALTTHLTGVVYNQWGSEIFGGIQL
jgi:hypothetical protein